MEIVITGKPIAKKRPRFFRRGPFVGAYNAQETEEGRWKVEAKGQITAPIDGPVSADMLFIMPKPKGLSRKKADALLHHVKKPDLDNLVKFAKDCLNGLAWRDDSQVCKLIALKIYGDFPKTIIKLEGAR